jgi:hypothetical protein
MLYVIVLVVFSFLAASYGFRKLQVRRIKEARDCIGFNLGLLDAPLGHENPELILDRILKAVERSKLRFGEGGLPAWDVLVAKSLVALKVAVEVMKKDLDRETSNAPDEVIAQLTEFKSHGIPAPDNPAFAASKVSALAYAQRHYVLAMQRYQCMTRLAGNAWSSPRAHVDALLAERVRFLP